MTDLTIAPLTVPQAQSATDLAFKVLYDAVISLKLPPGTKVSEVEVARQLDVSRQPVRDAFFRLSKLGFVAIRPQRATLITRISEQAILDAVFVRIALELECLRYAIDRQRPEDIDAIRQNLEAQTAALEDSDPGIFHALDEAFHETLCSVAGHTHVWTLIQEQKAHMDRLRFLTLSEERRRRVLEEHTSLLEALEQRDIALAEQRLRTHLTDIVTVLDENRQAYPDYFEAGE
ncbi:transcriptional regulator, GntR family [Poseidonocella pacifica]|uniref:Transcriptional regulator, GntR family n=1 Tax=Poseidonocella pacifica TaxID=871651 RepID=A0A1I0XJ16_9RHOB|nr:GntR family transcriptional regulator [Poseidonocella pacifica]SFB00981.1 transcriptional regulator, GntR family [Poseidonocella pacifica]